MKQHILLSLFFMSFCLLFFNCRQKEEAGSPTEEIILKLDHKSDSLKDNKEYDSAIFYSEKLLDISSRYSNSIYMAKANFRLGYCYKQQNKLLEAFQYYSASLDIHIKLGDNARAASCFLSMANIHKSLGDFGASQTAAIKGLDYLKSSSEKPGKTFIGLCHIVSVTLKEEGSYEEALEWNEKSFNAITDSTSEKRLANFIKVKNTTAGILIKQEKFEEAIAIYNRLLEKPEIKRDRKEYARILDNLGYALFLKNPDTTNAETFLKEALDIRREEKDVSGQIASHIHLTEFYLNVNKAHALFYATQAYENAKSMSALVSIREALYYIIRLKEVVKEALEDQEREKELEALRRETRSTYKTTIYNNEELKENNLILESQKNTAIVIGLFILLLSIFTYFILKSRHKREKLQKIYETEVRLAKKLHDEAANDIYNIMAMIQKSRHADKRILNKLHTVYAKVRDISHENNDIDFEENFETTLKDLLLNYEDNRVNIITRGLSKTNWNTTARSKRIAIYRALQELLVNMKKHSSATHVLVSFKKMKDKIVMEYSDNGIGYDLNHNPRPQNMENRIKAVNGTIIFESEKNKGFKAKITI